MIKELIDGVASVMTLDYFIVTLVGGVIGGVVASFFAPKHTLFAFRWYVIHVTFMLSALLLFYYVGRLAVAIVSSDPLWGRIVGAWLLLLLFSFCAGIGIYIGLRLRLRNKVESA